jgi:hypothetical protein
MPTVRPVKMCGRAAGNKQVAIFREAQHLIDHLHPWSVLMRMGKNDRER